jgi:hypothetical protein
VATAIACLALAADIEKIVLPLAFLLAGHWSWPSLFSEVGFIINEAFYKF